MKIKIYHGTTISKAKSIIGDGNFIFEDRPDHWLGRGIYFFVNDYDAAVWWANQRYSSDKKAVIEYELEIAEDDLLDLDTLTGMRAFNEFINANIEKTVILESWNKKAKDIAFRSSFLELYLKLYDKKSSMQTFTIPDREEFKPVLNLGFIVKERQIVIIDLSIIDINKIKIHFIK